MRITFMLPLLAVLAASVAVAQTTPGQALLVLSKGDRTLSIVDPATLQAVAHIPVGNDPHEVIASTDGKIAYVSNYGFGAYNTLAVVDLIRQRALPAVNLGPLWGPHGLAYAGDETWFTAEGAKAIGRYDPKTNKVDWILGTGQSRTHMIFVSQDLKSIYTTNVSSATVSLMEKSSHAGPDFGPPAADHATTPPPPPRRPGPSGPPSGNWDETVIPVGRGSEGFDVSPDGKEIWVANALDGTVSIVNIAAKRVSATLPLHVAGANRIKFTRDGKLALISMLSGGGVSVVDATTHQQIKQLELGHCAGIQMQPDGTRAFVACSGENYVAVVDLKTLAVSGRIQGIKEPDGLAWAVQR